MPIHDWTRVSAGTFHDFHQGWTIEIRNGIHFLMVDVFPSGSRDPQAMAQAIWDELVGESLGARPSEKLPAVAAFDAGDEMTAYVDARTTGLPLPGAPLFLAPG